MSGQSFDNRRSNDNPPSGIQREDELGERPPVALVPLSNGAYISMTDLTTPEVAERYRRAREELGLSFADIVERIVPPPQASVAAITVLDVAALESNPERTPLYVYEAVAKVLGQTVPQLMNEPMITIRPPRRFQGPET
jgi:hypothetical protein